MLIRLKSWVSSQHVFMKEKYIDQYGIDSLPHLKIAKEAGCDMFITTNEEMLDDREELEQKFNIKIKRPDEV